MENTDETVTLNLREISAGAFGWSAGDELPPPAVGAGSDGTGLASTVSGFALSAATLAGAGGVKSPAVRVFWTPITDPTVTAVLIQYRIAGTTDVLTARTEAVGTGEVVISAGIVAQTAHEFQASIETAPARETTWTAWAAVTTSEQVAGGVAPGSVTPEQFSAATRDMVLDKTGAAITSLQSALAQLAIIVADVDAAGELNKRELARSLSIQIGAAAASFSSQIAVAVGPDSALAAQITDLAAAVDDVSASLNVTFVADVTPAGAIAAFRAKAMAEGAEAGMLIVAKSGSGDPYSEIWFDADRFLITSGGANPTAAFLVDSSGPTPKIYIAADVIADGTITTSKIAAGAVKTISLEASSVTTDKIIIGGVATTNIAPGAVTAFVTETLTTAVPSPSTPTAPTVTVFTTSIVRTAGSACIVRANIGTDAWNMPYTDRGSGTVPVTVYRSVGGGAESVVYSGTLFIGAYPAGYSGGTAMINFGGNPLPLEFLDTDNISGSTTYRVVVGGVGSSGFYVSRIISMTEYKR